jgi:hypothetical protein
VKFGPIRVPGPASGGILPEILAVEEEDVERLILRAIPVEKLGVAQEILLVGLLEFTRREAPSKKLWRMTR